jgi:hypothetical protein
VVKKEVLNQTAGETNPRRGTRLWEAPGEPSLVG